MAPIKTLRILCLHGFTQNPNLFSAKTAALRKALQKTFPSSLGYDLRFSYPCGTNRLAMTDIPGSDIPGADSTSSEEPDAWGWWVKKDVEGRAREGNTQDIVYDGLEKSLDLIARCIRDEGPFDGVIGFSQGAAAAVMVASLLEGSERQKAFDLATSASSSPGIPYPQSFKKQPSDWTNGAEDVLIQQPMKFGVSYSGFRSSPENLRAFYEPKVKTPVLHVLGQVDVVVEEARGRALIDACEKGAERVVVHPGGHFVPSQKPWLDAVVGFVKSCVEEDSQPKGQHQDDTNVEDMDVPF